MDANVSPAEDGSGLFSAGHQPAHATAAQYAKMVQQPPNNGGMQPSANANDWANDPNCKTLYVGNLDPRVTEQMLFDIFSTVAKVVSAKIIPDKHLVHGGMNYGFVEFASHAMAQQALMAMNGHRVVDSEIRVNWAFAGSSQSREDTSNHHHIFVGDLSPEVNDQILAKAFSAFPSMSDARVMWDASSGKSRGYGFVAFREKSDAEQAINTMNGEWLGNRAIRVNWANQKIPANRSHAHQPLSYEAVLAQTSEFNCTVYVGNLTPYTTQEQLVPLFSQCGFVTEIRMQADRGFAFVKMNSHEAAAMAITSLQGQSINGRTLKVSWGKDRSGDKMNAMYQQGAMNSQYSHPYPYGMPQYPNIPSAGQPNPSGAIPAGTTTATTTTAAAAAAAAATGPWSGYNYEPQLFYNPLYQQPGQGIIPGVMPPISDPSIDKNGMLPTGY